MSAALLDFNNLLNSKQADTDELISVLKKRGYRVI